MRFVWNTIPGGKQPEVQSQAAENHSIPAFLQSLREGKSEDNEKIREHLGEINKLWTREGYDREKDPENLVERVRLADTNENSPKLARHTRLSRSFLTLENPSEKLGSFSVNFEGNALSERRVGAADMLPASAYQIEIHKGNEIIKATRAQNQVTKRIGYYQTDLLKPASGGEPVFNYIPVHSGDRIVITEERNITDDDITREWEQVYKYGAMKELATEQAEKQMPFNTREELRKKYTRERMGFLFGIVKGQTPPTTALGYADRSTVAPSKPSSYVTSPDQLPPDDSGRLLRPNASPEKADRVVQLARQYANASREDRNIFKEDFATIPELKGGNVGCAWVASRILSDAGYLDDGRIMAVATVEKTLRAKDWQDIPEGQQQPGDVVIWEKLPPTVLPSGGTRPGHEHIGIVTGPDMAVDNDGISRNGPVERRLTRYYVDPKTGEKVLRKVKCFLRAPTSSSTNNAPEASNNRTMGDVIRSEAARLNIDPGFAKAIIRVEAKNGINENGQVTIRFEPHVFNKFLGIQGKSDTAGSWGADKINGRSVAGISCEGGQGGEYGCFRKALEINSDAAFKAISMGAGQIMGFNAKSLGYKSAEDMYQHFSLQGGGEAEQTAAMFKFIENNPALLSAAQQSDYVKFAQIYNGAPAGTAKNTQYAQDLKRYHIGGSNNGTATA